MQYAATDEVVSQRLLYIVSKAMPDAGAVNVMAGVQKVRDLVGAGAAVDYVCEDDGMTCVAHAILNGHMAMLRVLQELGASLDHEILGQHPLVFAGYRRPEFVVPLAQLGSGRHMPEEQKTLISAEVRQRLEQNEIDNLALALFGERNASSDHREHVLYDFQKVKDALAQEHNDTRKHFLKQLLDKSPYRTYAATPLESCLDPLYESFPNFRNVLDYLKREIGLANLSPRAVFTISPILLYGAPGIGKTRFVNELCRVLKLEFNILHCGSVTAGWVIAGASTSWQDGRPGLVHTSFRDGATGNPVIMLDEVDKLGGDTRYDGFGSLYQLLEPSTSSKFKDEAVGVEIDCSRTIWFATANNPEVIPEPILSRLRMIEVVAPTKSEMPAIIKSILVDLLNDANDSWGQFFSTNVSEDISEWLSEQSPRDIRRLLREAMGEAAIRVRGNPELQERLDRGLELINLQKSDFYQLRQKKMAMGFC